MYTIPSATFASSETKTQPKSRTARSLHQTGLPSARRSARPGPARCSRGAGGLLRVSRRHAVTATSPRAPGPPGWPVIMPELCTITRPSHPRESKGKSLLKGPRPTAPACEVDANRRAPSTEHGRQGLPAPRRGIIRVGRPGGGGAGVCTHRSVLDGTAHSAPVLGNRASAGATSTESTRARSLNSATRTARSS